MTSLLATTAFVLGMTVAAYAVEPVDNAADAVDDANVAGLGITVPLDTPDDFICSAARRRLSTAWARANLRLKGNNALDRSVLQNEMMTRYQAADRTLEWIGEHNDGMKARGRTDDTPTCSEALPQLVTGMVGDINDTSMYDSQEAAQARESAERLAKQKRFVVEAANMKAKRDAQKANMDPAGRVNYDTMIGDYTAQAEDCKAVPNYGLCPAVLNAARMDKARRDEAKAGMTPEKRVLYDIDTNDWSARKEDCRAVPDFDICPTVLAN